MNTLASPSLSSYIAQQMVAGQGVSFDEIIFCNIPNLSAENLAEHLNMPSDEYIVHRQAISQAGFVNDNAVVYSVTMGTEIGDFDFNYIALINSQQHLLAVAVYTNTIKKIKNKNGIQGNAVTRSILLEFANAKQITNITIPAQTWQIDFTARLTSIDEKIRLTNRDLYGRAVFFNDGFLLRRKTGNNFSIQAGAAYIEGIRAYIASAQDINLNLPCSVYLDISHHGTVTGAYQTQIKFLKQQQSDYIDNAGHQHYVQILADIASNGTVTDRRILGNQFVNKSGDTMTGILEIDAPASFIQGKRNGNSKWWVGKGRANSDDISLVANALNNQIVLKADRTESEKPLFVKEHQVYHPGHFPKAAEDNYGLVKLSHKTNGTDKTKAASEYALGEVRKLANQANTAAGNISLDWDSIASKPRTYPPSSHTHGIRDITGLQEALNNKIELSQFTQSLNNNGWCKLPNGLILQWGKKTGNTDRKQYFSVAFRQILSVATTARDVWDTWNWSFTFDNTGIWVNNQSGRIREYNYIAIGI